MPLPWQVEASPGLVLGMERLKHQEAIPSLLSLAPGGSLQALILHKHIPTFQYWRIRFSTPLVRRETLTLRALLNPRPVLERNLLALLLGPSLALPTARELNEGSQFLGDSWDIPLVLFPQADPQEVEVALQPAGIQ